MRSSIARCIFRRNGPTIRESISSWLDKQNKRYAAAMVCQRSAAIALLQARSGPWLCFNPPRHLDSDNHLVSAGYNFSAYLHVRLLESGVAAIRIMLRHVGREFARHWPSPERSVGAAGVRRRAGLKDAEICAMLERIRLVEENTLRARFRRDAWRPSKLRCRMANGTSRHPPSPLATPRTP